MTDRQWNDDQHEWLAGISVFLVRERGLAYLDTLRNQLDRHGFNVLCNVPLKEDQQQALARLVGENGREGTSRPDSGGPLAHLLVVHDVHPMAQTSSLRDAPGRIENERVLSIKAKIRDKVNQACSAQEQCDPLHVASYGLQALEYLERTVPQRIEEICQAARRYDAAFRTPYPVLADLSRQVCRAKVELVDFHGTEAICKTFRPGRERYLEREVKARELGASLPEVSRLLEVGPHYLVFERYANRMERILSPRAPFSHHGLLPIWTIERVRAVILHYRRLGYECIDLDPQDLIYDPCQGLKIIDFEFLQPGPDEIETLKGNYVWYDVPTRFTGDLPLSARQSSYRQRWFPYTGLPRTLCLNELPRPILAMVRSVALVPLTLDGLRRVGWHHIQRLVRD
ncbi:hypothetical protein R5M92_08565 [Halomonas sp. Bachu 37]|uniref:hypothetical protein n=1 Tax=Halomonas kashgarensis TaxID=3084920 RepID=UPI003216DB74